MTFPLVPFSWTTCFGSSVQCSRLARLYGGLDKSSPSSQKRTKNRLKKRRWLLQTCRATTIPEAPVRANQSGARADLAIFLGVKTEARRVWRRLALRRWLARPQPGHR